ncbi:MAG: hydroxymethylglutaryl-CoA reductase (NADPH) [Methanocellales archaeon]
MGKRIEKKSAILKKLIAGELSFHEIDQYVKTKQAIELRRRALEEMMGIKLKHIKQFTIDAEAVARYNIENMIGVVQVPLGIAGPLLIDGEYAKGNFYIPLATTEGALVASVNRGCSAITASGGAKAKVFLDNMTRAPVFKASSIAEAVKLIQWVKDNFEELKNEVKKSTRHGELLYIDAYAIGRLVYLRMAYDTKDAMGMNMVTIATERLAKIIEERTGSRLIALSGNMCVDKKPAAINLILGRGKSVAAEAVIKREVVEKTLKTSPEAIIEVNQAKLIGSAKSASLGFNAHFANIIAAVFIATGQDAAQVVEGACGITYTELLNEDLYISVTIPSLEIGSVGGGTRVETQRECLQILGVHGSGSPPGLNAKKFAEIIACSILAGELSLLGALASGHLALAHEMKR